MEQLLQIKSIPVQLQFKINDAKYEINSKQPAYEMTRDKGKMSMESSFVKVNIDTFEARYSAGIKSTIRAVEDYAKKGMSDALQATATYAQEGNQMANIDSNPNPIPSIEARKFLSEVEFNLGFIPGKGPEISWDPNELSIRYEMDRLQFNWKFSKPEIKYTPASIEFIISQYPDVEINYVGDPLYIPPSSDPNYKPIDTQA